MKIEYKIIGVLAIVLMVTLHLLKTEYNRAENVTDLNNVMSKKIIKTKNELGQERATVEILKAENKKTFLRLKSKDTVISKLQEVVKDYKGKLHTALFLSNQTKIKVKYKTKVLRDTIEVENKKVISPVYFTEWSNKWEKGFIRAGADSIQRVNTIKNDYQLTIGERSNGWFKPRIYNADILNLNPNTETQELRSFTVRTKPKRFVFGLQAGYGLVSYYDDSGGYKVKRGFFIGGGVNYTILSIK